MMNIRFLILTSLFFAFSAIRPEANAQVSPQATVKTAEGANDPMAHSYMEKTRKWINACKNIDIRFEACTEENNQPTPSGCQRSSLLVQGIKYRLIMGADEYYCNGTDLWVYTVANHEVAVYSASETLPDLNPVSLIKNHDKFYRAKYIRQQTLGGSARHIIDLTPRQRSEVTKIRLYLNESDAKFYKIEVYLPQNRRFIYNNFSFRENVPSKASDFVFDTAKFPDVMVNDMR